MMNVVAHKPPSTPLCTRRQCFTGKLRRRNAMTPSEIRSAKSRKWGVSPQIKTPTKRVNCFVIPNPTFETPIRKTNSKSKPEFYYYSNRERSNHEISAKLYDFCFSQDQCTKSSQNEASASRNFLKAFWLKVKPGKSRVNSIPQRKSKVDIADYQFHSTSKGISNSKSSKITPKLSQGVRMELKRTASHIR